MHSPYAYRFVKDVLRPRPYGYYAYQEANEFLEGKESHNHNFVNLIRFTIRLVIFLQAKRLILAGDKPRFAEIAAKALKIQYIKISDLINFKFQNSDLLILTPSANLHLPPSFHAAITSPSGDLESVSIFAMNPSPEIRRYLEIPVPKGLLLNGKRNMILVPRPGMEYVAYDININFR